MVSLAPLAIGLAALIAVAVVRGLVLWGPAPSGIDGGNWLAFGTFSRPGLAYPPLVPVLFATLSELVGPVAATAVAGGVASGVPALAVLGVAAWAGRAELGAIAALLVVTSASVGEAVAWGGYPQPLATGFAVVALVALAAWLRGGSRLALAVLGAAFAGVFATSHLVVAPTALAGAIMAVHAAWKDFRWRRRVLGAALAAAPAAVLLAPTYLSLLGTLDVGPAGEVDLARILGPAWLAYVALLVAVPAAVIIPALRPGTVTDVSGPRAGSIRSRAGSIRSAAAAACGAWGVLILVTREPRLVHDVATLVPFAIVALAPALRLPTAGRAASSVIAAAVMAGAVMAGAGLAAFPGQAAYYRVLTPGDVAVLDWLDRQAIGSNRLLVADRRGVPLGWWAEGWTGEQALFASDLRWLRFAAERNRARLANELLYDSSFPAGVSSARLAEAGIRFVYLPSGSAFGIDPASPPTGWEVAFSAADAVVLRPLEVLR
jgi:hypothetical protein